MAYTIFGLLQKNSGKLYLNGKEVKIEHPFAAIRFGIGYLPEERKEQSILPIMNIKENITISNLKKYSLILDQIFYANRKGYLHQSSELKAYFSSYID